MARPADAAASPSTSSVLSTAVPPGVAHASRYENDPRPVEVFIGGERLWKPSTLGEALRGTLEFVFEGQLVDPAKVREFGGLCGVEGVTRDKIDICMLPPTRCPTESDVVQVLDMDIEPPLGTHCRFSAIGNLQGGEKVRFQYDLYDAVAIGPGEFELRFVDTQWGVVRRTWKSTTDTIVDLTYRAGDGKETTLSGTVEHPFFVPAIGDFVAMSRLGPGTVLETNDGSIATVVSSSLRQGEFEVYGFDVEGLNTYFVSASAGDPGVLVHNSSGLTKKFLAAAAKNTAALRRQAARMTGFTPELGMSRVSAGWRARFGPASMREHHLVPQAMLSNRGFMRQLRGAIGGSADDAVNYVHRQVSLIPHRLHAQVHDAGWNDAFAAWFKANPRFTKNELQSQLRTMMRDFDIPGSSRNARTYGRN